MRLDWDINVKVVSVRQDIADFSEEGNGIVAIIIVYSYALGLDLHKRLFTKLAASGVNSSVVVWVR